MLTDTHCHIYKEYYENIDELMDKINYSGVNRIINNACNFKTCKEVLDLASKYNNMFIALGLHPEEDLDEINDVLELIKNNRDNKKLVAIGEIGLDYYYTKENKEKQIEVLEKQLELATKLKLPVIIHNREATGDIINILKKYNVRGVIHCFNGSKETARKYIKLGYKLGINGVVTFKNCKLIDVIREIGVDNLVFETDSPYLTPVPDRGKKNDPSYVNNIVDFISNSLNVDRKKLVDISNRNIRDIFDI